MLKLKGQDVKKKEVQVFYDALASGRLLADYIYGNPRIEAAIRHARRWIPENVKRILDIGCGIGWSTYEIKRNHPDAYVLGIDISEKAIEVAKRLFDTPGLTFAVHDVTQWSDILQPPFDAIVMLDVYEHIPRGERSRAHDVLNRSLSPEGYALFTFPSLLCYRFIREHQPSALQPVDEDVTLEDVERLSDDVGGTVIYYKHIDVWHTNEYVHIVIQRQPKVMPVSNVTKLRQIDRKKHVASRLGVRVR